MGSRYFIKDELCLYKSVAKLSRSRKGESADRVAQDIVNNAKVDVHYRTPFQSKCCPSSDPLSRMYYHFYLVRDTLRGKVPFDWVISSYHATWRQLIYARLRACITVMEVIVF